MTMSTPTLDEAVRLIQLNILIDTVQIMDVGQPVTVGINVTRELIPVGQPIPGLVQTTVLANAIESVVNNTYSVKVARGTDLKPGQAVKVITARQEPDLEGKVFLIDKISLNGAAMLRKGVASDFDMVDQQGKEGLQ